MWLTCLHRLFGSVTWRWRRRFPKPEAFGRTAVEPQAMGRPVLAADHGAATETVVEGETGWRVAPGDLARVGGGPDQAALDARAGSSARRWARAGRGAGGWRSIHSTR